MAKTVKHCMKCGAQAGCIDTRHVVDGRIRRRYKCKRCKTRHTTLEMRVVGDSTGKHVETLDKMLLDRAREELQADFRELLGVNLIVRRPRRSMWMRRRPQRKST